jgi:hypothetical protein
MTGIEPARRKALDPKSSASASSATSACMVTHRIMKLMLPFFKVIVHCYVNVKYFIINDILSCKRIKVNGIFYLLSKKSLIDYIFVKHLECINTSPVVLQY